jgi:hypothetical protein
VKRTVIVHLTDRPSVIVQDRADPAVPIEQRTAAVAEQVEVERLVGLLLAVALHFDGDRLGRLAGAKVSRAGLVDVVLVAGFRGAVRAVRNDIVTSRS